MHTIRLNTFETNSSSAHCFVTASDLDFDKFVNGELFADSFEYKWRYDAKLITIDEAYDLYCNYRDWYSPKLSKESYKWVLTHPECLDGSEPENDMPDYVRAEYDKDPYSVQDILNMDPGLPISYQMIRKNSEDFTKEYDGYESVPPSSENGMTTCYAVWYY